MASPVSEIFILFVFFWTWTYSQACSSIYIQVCRYVVHMWFSHTNIIPNYFVLHNITYCSPWFERENWPFLKSNKKGQNLWNLGSHIHQNWFACISQPPLLAWIFWANSIFWPPWTIVHGPKGKFGRFWRPVKRGKISETEDATPIKIGLHAFHNHFYLHEYFEPILFFDPHGL